MTTHARVALITLAVLALTALPVDAALYFQAEGPMGADFDGDGTVGFPDFVAFAARYGTSTNDPGFEGIYDLNNDGFVNFDDFVQFSEAFGSSGSTPTPDPTYLIYVLDAGTSSIDVYNLSNHLLQEFLPFRSPSSLAVSVNQDRVFVFERFGLFVMDGAHQVLFSVPGSAQGRLVLSPDEKTAYMSEITKNSVRVIDLVARAAVDTLAVGQSPSDMAITPDGRRLLISNDASISILDLASGFEEARLNVGGAPGTIVVAGDGRRAYYTLFSRPAVGVLDLDNNEILGEIQLEGDRSNSLTFSPDGTRLFVNVTTSLVEVDPSRNLVIRELTVGAETSDVAITPDGKWAYVGSLEPNNFTPSLAVVDLQNWKIIGRLRGFTFPAQIRFRRNQ